MNKCLPVFLTIVLATGSYQLSAQFHGLYLIKNCQHETRIDNYYKQVKFFYWWYLNTTNFQQQKLLQFAPGYQPDSVALRKDIEKLRTVLPDTFKNTSRVSIGLLHDNKPPQPGHIWFTEVFAETDKTGHFKVFAAYTITFEGKDGRLEENRNAPRIKNIRFIFDEALLLGLSRKLAALAVSQDVHN